MASRTKQKEEARARRLAEERAAAERAQRTRRTRMLGGVLVLAVVIVAVAIAISASGGGGGKPVNANSSAARSDVAAVSNLLSGIPQSGTTLGNPKAPVTITEYADLECPVCDSFALPTSRQNSDGGPGSGYLDQLINQYVKTGKAKITYRSLETATGNGPNASMWPQQQAAALAAGLQNKAWDYIELFYYEQQGETTQYVNPAFLQSIAQQVPGLNLASWQANRQNPNLEAQVQSDGNAANALGFQYTPTLVIKGPKGQATPIQSLPSSYNEITSEINLVS
ncbi:MAG TPA: thioredoxin domain-containing protein [Solirubrobacteraceae bacterium]|nr:thioredoxin domain-containing protein [Solirubrobacteraceae bacterium]